MATLRDLSSQPFEIGPFEAAAAGEPVTAPDDRWVVLADESGPVSAIAPGTSLAAGARPSGILVAAADLDLAEAFESDAFRQLTEVSCLVLTEPGAGEARGPGVAGVVSGSTLSDAVIRGTVRGFADMELPGVPSVPLISRSCGFSEGGTACATPMSFRRRPSRMPRCPNDRGLTAHAFSW